MVIGCNDGDAILLAHSSKEVNRIFPVRLRGPRGNPTSIGAKVTVAHASGLLQSAEISAGGGYLSQSSATIYFGNPDNDPAKSIQIRWPDGTNSVVEIVAPDSIIIAHPGLTRSRP